MAEGMRNKRPLEYQQAGGARTSAEPGSIVETRWSSAGDTASVGSGVGNGVAAIPVTAAGEEALAQTRHDEVPLEWGW